MHHDFAEYYITMVSLCRNYAYAIYKTYDKMWSVALNGQVYQSGDFVAEI